MNRNIKKTVYKILQEDQYAREDDNYLILLTLQKLLPCNKATAFITILQGMKYKGISFESITRCRRKFLEENPQLKEQIVENARRIEEENYIVEYGKNRRIDIDY